MEFQQYFVKDWKSIPNAATESEKASACFDCSICLEFARDPVVTLCGHLYCWPCIYKWFDSQIDQAEFSLCPVCKAQISEKTMVPLYGRGQSVSQSGSEGKIIPPRPPACAIKASFNPESRDPNQNRRRYYLSNNGGDSSLFARRAMAVSHPVVGMFGEMVYERMFGDSEGLYSYSPRMRRRELQADQSLNRVSIFFFCCLLLCLFLF